MGDEPRSGFSPTADSDSDVGLKPDLPINNSE